MVIKLTVVKRLAAVLMVGAASSIITWNVAKHKFEEEADFRVNETRDYYRDKLDEQRKNEAETVVAEKIDRPDRAPSDIPEELWDQLKKYGSQQVTSKEARVLSVETEYIEPEDRPEIHILTGEEFYSDSPEFPYQEKYSAVYYEGDDVMTDEHDEVIENYSRAVGSEFLTEFKKHGNEDTVYVRNTRLKSDWEIQLEKGSYHELILGYTPEPVKKRPRKFRDDE